MPEREATPTQSALLELREEREGMREGYGFLDEKRLILAAEILGELKGYEQEMAAFRRAFGAATDALRAAVARHGLEGLGLYPVERLSGTKLCIEYRSVLGVMVQEVDCEAGELRAPYTAVDASPEAELCRQAFFDLIPRAARLAVLTGNLERLRLEYRRTARRARALEDVLLPEIEENLEVIGAALEELDREEAIRVRQVRQIP